MVRKVNLPPLEVNFHMKKVNCKVNLQSFSGPVIDVVSLNCIQPSRIAVDIDRRHMYMMRFEGLDTLPVPVNNI